MILAIDSASAACTAALLSSNGTVVAERHELIGRGHAERLMPMVNDLLGDKLPSQILVGVGPGSFTGLRVALAAAHGMAIGWDVPVAGFDSLALIAASAPGDGVVAVAMLGGHGQWFVGQYDRPSFRVIHAVTSMAPADAVRIIDATSVVGTAASALVELRGFGEAANVLPHAVKALALSSPLRSLEPKPVYARLPDAKPAVAA